MDGFYSWIGLAASAIGSAGLVAALVRRLVGSSAPSEARAEAFAAAGLMSVGLYLVTDAAVLLVLFAGFMVATAAQQVSAKRERRETGR